ncbi:MAG: homoserine dehydrogenase, partial [Actinomycetaceae bacterium]|nr:homoserine dehydrogenase [Actinomycetaceae bacterium]
MKDEVKVALLGCGTVGTQVARLLSEQAEDFAARSGARLRIIGIAVRDASAPRDPAIDPALLTEDANSIIDQADIVIELIGGIEPARTHILRAFQAGASVVTGNKALLAEHGPELYEAAAAANVDLYYEAAVAGAIPVVYGLRESLAGDRITQVLGIVNGTTNYILDEMTVAGLSFDEALKQAQELGFAEADPTADVDGLDAAAKCAILASLAFHTRVELSDVEVTGIRNITAADIASATAAG